MDEIIFKNKNYKIIDKDLHHKLHVSRGAKEFMIVPFNNYESMMSYIKSKKILKKARVEMNKILSIDKKNLLILENYISGELVIKLIAENRFDEKCADELFRIYRNNRFAKISLIYKPENFVKHKKYFYYLVSEVAPYDKTIAFEKTDDVLLWVNSINAKRYVESKGFTFVDRPLLEGPALKKHVVMFCLSHW